MPDLRATPGQYAELLQPLLIRAGIAAYRWSGQAQPRLKDDGSEVSNADLAAEEVLVEGLSKAWPGSAIVSEESGGQPGDGDTWYVDPIDGTGAFLEGLAHWGPTVCLVRDGVLHAGALWFPRIGEFWFAGRGAGAWCNGQRLAPADPGPPDRQQSLYLPSRFHHVRHLAWPGRVRALGSSAAHLALVASGGAVATLIPRWKLWDVGCGTLLVEEAGRQVVDLDGHRLDPVGRRDELLLAGTPTALHHLLTHGRATLGEARRDGSGQG